MTRPGTQDNLRPDQFLNPLTPANCIDVPLQEGSTGERHGRIRSA